MLLRIPWKNSRTFFCIHFWENSNEILNKSQNFLEESSKLFPDKSFGNFSEKNMKESQKEKSFEFLKDILEKLRAILQQILGKNHDYMFLGKKISGEIFDGISGEIYRRIHGVISGGILRMIFAETSRNFWTNPRMKEKLLGESSKTFWKRKTFLDNFSMKFMEDFIRIFWGNPRRNLCSNAESNP